MTSAIDAQTLTGISLAHLPTDPASLRFSPVKTGKHNASFWVECDADAYSPPNSICCTKSKSTSPFASGGAAIRREPTRTSSTVFNWLPSFCPNAEQHLRLYRQKLQ